MTRMPLRFLLPAVLIAGAAAAAALVGSASGSPAASGIAASPTTIQTPYGTIDTKNCAKYAGVESSGSKNSLDPAQQPSSQNSLNVNATYDRLTTEDDNWKVLPDLATSWKSNKTGTVWTFNLRKGVTFSDGKPFTSKDVVWTFQRVIDPKTGSEGAPQMSFLTKQGIQAAGPYAVRFITKKPVAELPLLITNKNTFITEAGTPTATLRTKGAGTGPFIPVNFSPTKQVQTFVRNPHYWRPGLPKAPCLQLYVIQEASSMLAALQTGQVDFSQQVDYSVVPVLQKDSKVKLLTTGPSTSMTMPMWVDTAPFKDVRVRQALKKVVDRKQMVDTVLHGFGVIGDDNPVPPTSPDAWRHTVPGPDIAGAEKLLAAAGYNSSNPLKVDLYTADVIPAIVNMTQLFKEQAAKAGIQVNVITGPASEYWDNVWLKHPFEISAWSARPAGLALSIAYLQNAPYPETHWKVPAYDALIKKANTTVNPAARRKVYQQAEKMLTLQGGEIIPMFQRVVAAERSNCTGYTPSIQFVQFDLTHLACT
jgi:peptide/nickel transport system substrate-binding protein